MIALMAKNDDPFRPQPQPRIPYTFRRIVLLCDRQHGHTADKSALHAAEELVDPPLAAAPAVGREDFLACPRVEMEEKILWERPFVPKSARPS